MTALVTGGAGFVGSHLSEALVARGERVIILDDLSTGSVNNIRHLRNHPLVECYFESMMERSLLCELVDEADVVYHLPAAVGGRPIIESPAPTIATNATGIGLVLGGAG